MQWLDVEEAYKPASRTEVGHGGSFTSRSPDIRWSFTVSNHKHGIHGNGRGQPHEEDQYLLLSPRTEEGLHAFERVHDTIVHAVHAESPDNEKQPSLLFVRPLPRSSYPVKSCNAYLVSVSSSSPNMAARLASTLSCLRSRAALVLARLPSISSLIVLSRAASALALWICALLAQMLQIVSR